MYDEFETTQTHFSLRACLAFFVTRLLFLTRIPIFTDEAIYLRWGLIGLRDASHRFLSLEDGKQPLFIWLMYPLLKIFSDPLVAGRMVSVFAGFFSLIGIALLAKVFFGPKAIVPAGLLYIISPFFLLYDRLALYDSLTTTFAIWALLLQVILVSSLRLDIALLLGFAIGGGLLTKSSALFSVFLLPFSLLLFDYKKPHLAKRLSFWIALASVSLTVALLLSAIIKLSPLQHMVAQKNLTFILPFSQFIHSPFSRIVGNLGGMWHWLTAYFSWPWIISICISAVLAFRRFPRQTLLLISWFVLPFLALAAFAIVLYPRFILFMSFPLLLLLSFLPTLMKSPAKNKAVIVPTLLLLAWPVYFSLQLIFNPIHAPLPNADRFQFISDWPAGYGINEVVEFAKQASAHEPIFIATEGTFGLTPYALEIYLQGTPNLTIKGYWPISDGLAEILEIAQHQTAYILFKDTQIPKPDWPLQLVAKYRKGDSQVFMNLYKVKAL